MKIKYFRDTDTLYIEFQNLNITETRDLDEYTMLDLDSEGNICAITMEYASTQTEIPPSFELIAA